MLGIAVTITNPIELLRTRVQAGNRNLETVLKDIRQMVKVYNSNLWIYLI